MAEITRESLLARLAEYEKRKAHAIAEAQALGGAIVAVQELLRELAEKQFDVGDAIVPAQVAEKEFDETNREPASPAPGLRD
jgi:hypothetical protein